MSSVQELAANQTLFEKGGASDVVYLVESGELEAFALNRGQATVFGRIAAGEFVGELGVLQGQPRSASVRAIVPGSVSAYGREEFIELISNDRDHCLKLMHSMSLRTRMLLDLIDDVNHKIHDRRPTRISFVERWWQGFFRWWAGKLRGGARSSQTVGAEQPICGTIRLRPDEILFRQGQSSPVACKLLAGKLKVVRAGKLIEHTVGHVLPGEFVGEIGLLEGTPRSATVKAVVRSEVEILDQPQLQRLIEQDSSVGRRMVDTLSRRSIRLSTDLQRLYDEYGTKLDRPSLARIQDLLKSVGEAYEVTNERLERDFNALQRGMALEAIAAREMMGTYYRFVRRQATPQEMEEANAEFRNLLKSLGLGTLFVLPGSPITIPAAIKIARSFGIDILPKNRLSDD